MDRKEPEWFAEARRLRDEGLTRSQISAAVGKAKGSLPRAMNPQMFEDAMARRWERVSKEEYGKMASRRYRLRKISPRMQQALDRMPIKVVMRGDEAVHAPGALCMKTLRALEKRGLAEQCVSEYLTGARVVVWTRVTKAVCKGETARRPTNGAMAQTQT